MYSNMKKKKKSQLLYNNGQCLLVLVEAPNPSKWLRCYSVGIKPIATDFWPGNYCRYDLDRWKMTYTNILTVNVGFKTCSIVTHSTILSFHYFLVSTTFVFKESLGFGFEISLTNDTVRRNVYMFFKIEYIWYVWISV